jgi:plastocyanin
MIVAMRLRRLAPAAAGVLATLLLAAPAESQAPPTLAVVYAIDNAFTTDGGGPANVTIAAGGHVNFSYFMGNSRHNVVFTGPRPTVCGISEGPAGTAAALPAQPSPPLWEGGCDFDVAGTYAFVCGLHPSMTGSVTAVQTAASPPPPPAQAPDVTLDPTAGGPAASAVKVATRQRGLTVRGSVLVARGGSRVLARAFARRRALSPRSSSKLVTQVGRRLRTSVPAGRVAFSAPLNAAARAALRRNGRLLITLRLTVTPVDGSPYNAARTVILRPPRVTA